MAEEGSGKVAEVEITERTDAKISVEILLREYEHRFIEVGNCLQRYHKQADYLYLFLSSVVAVSAVLFSANAPDPGNAHGDHLKPFLYCGLLMFGAMFLFHLHASIMDALCMVRFNGEGLAALEKRINAFSGRNLLNWEHQAVADYFNKGEQRVGCWVKPHNIAGIWMFLIFVFICMAFCALAVKFTPCPFWCFYLSLVLAFMLFHVFEWFLMLDVGFGYLHSYFEPSSR